MGYEAACTARVGRKTSAGKALLESESLVFRGDFKLEIPFDRMKSVTADGATLVVGTADQEARFDLGPSVAQRWAWLIKEPKSLFEKLELTPQSRVAVVGMTDPMFLPALREHVAAVAEERVPEGAETIFFGVSTLPSLQKIPLLRARMSDAGTLWIVRPKASKAIPEPEVLGALRAAGLVDTKVVAFSRTHTAHKCVVPVELRGQSGRPRLPFVSLPPGPARVGAKTKPAVPSAKKTAPSKSAPAKKKK